MKRGFTLVELLVVIGAVSIIGLMLTEVFYRSLRGGNKSALIGVIKQNGQSALESMDKNIRSANNVVCPATSSSSNTLVILKEDGTYTRYRLSPEGSTNGDIRQDNPTICLSCVPSETLTGFINRICDGNDPLQSPTILTDTNTRTGVSVAASPMPQFTKSKQAGFKDLVTISFNLKPAVGAPKAVADQVDPVAFTTTVELR